MTMQEIIQELATLSIDERKELIYILVESLTATTEPQPTKRIPGLHQGTTWASDDFDAPLLNEKGDS